MQASASCIWLRYFRVSPQEWVWHCSTRKKKD
ncbi:MAG: DUF418 domain-containing protein [Bacteroidales bacterium]|nr:DUF418 domain-containing protein [Bacteroidales bacterium]